jgi:hypothetical protein
MPKSVNLIESWPNKGALASQRRMPLFLSLSLNDNGNGNGNDDALIVRNTAMSKRATASITKREGHPKAHGQSNNFDKNVY